MSYPKEGYIKYKLSWKKTDFLDSSHLKNLIYWRDICLKNGGLGYCQEMNAGIGNLSQRFSDNSFYISGSQTGHIQPSTHSVFTKVKYCNILENEVICEGPVKASSETMTHFACYKANISIKAIIHIHHNALWHKYKEVLPTTEKNIDYGSVEMANAIGLLSNKGSDVIIMGGHADGIFILGRSLDEAGHIYLSLLKKV